jgi:hypothetical protein
MINTASARHLLSLFQSRQNCWAGLFNLDGNVKLLYSNQDQTVKTSPPGPLLPIQTVTRLA